MRLVPLLILSVALPLAAQTPDPTPPERYYPLAVGDVREYRTTVIWPAAPGSYLRESVVGTTQEDGRTYHLVNAVEYNVSGAETSRRTRLVRFDSALAVPVEREANGFENPITPCRLDLPFGSLGSSDDCPFYSGSPSETVLGVQTSVKTFVNLIGDARYAAGFGFVSSNIEEGQQIETRLRYARIDGVTYGWPDPVLPPLPPEPSAYWPLAIGNTWVVRYDLLAPRYEWQVVRTAVVVSDTSYASVERCTRYDGAPATCDTALVRVDDRTGEIYERLGDGEAAIMCGLLPTAESGPLPCDLMGLATWELTTQAPSTVQIGTATVPTPSLRTVAVPDFSMSYAAGIGPLPTAGLTGVGTLVYARIGGIEYGVNPVAGEGVPPAPALALRVAPNPAGGPVTLAVVGATSPADVEVFDALGRRVWRGTVAGETTVDARGWGPGVYVLRATAGDATAGDATATTRLVRR